jgi:hypothetical protein
MQQEPDMPNGDHDVGYGKPPRDTQFQKGQSGNPSGRPKRPENFAQFVRHALNKKIVTEENGQRRTITKRQAMADQLVSRAMAGDLRSIQEMLKLLERATRERIIVQLRNF